MEEKVLELAVEILPYAIAAMVIFSAIAWVLGSRSEKKEKEEESEIDKIRKRVIR